MSEPKTASGKRTITLPMFLIDLLKQHRAEQVAKRLAAGSNWHDHDIVFSNTRGVFFEPSSLQRAFQRLLKDAGLAHIRLHDLRHSAATLLLKMGLPAHVVEEILGHSDIRTTLGIYGHVFPAMHDDAMEKMGGLFGGENFSS